MKSNFERDMRREQVRVVTEATEAIRSVALALYSDLQVDAKTVAGYGSPVASGRYASSIRVGINRIDPTTAPRDPSYKYQRPLRPRTIRNQPVSRIAALLRTWRLGDTIYISNSVPYARRIELGRHSWQTPDGVFGPTVRRILTKFRNARITVNANG